MGSMTRERVLDRARQIGMKAPVDTSPDQTEWGLALWQENLMMFFGCAADNLIAESGVQEEMRPEILAAMKEGVKRLMGTPHGEESQREKALRIVDHVFDKELLVHPHHCTH